MTAGTMGALSGRRVIVTRSAERSGALADLLRDAGADVLEIPVTTTMDAGDGGTALMAALASLTDYDWLVVTSPEGARRVTDAAGRVHVDLAGVKRAAVGTATAHALGGADLVPDTQTGANLGVAFPAGSGRVLLAVAESAGTDFETAARAKGWVVDRVHSYRTVAVRPTGVTAADISACDAITFTATSAVEAWIAAFGGVVPPVVVAMGPQTARALRHAGIDGVVVASEQSLSGVVAALG